MSFCSARGPRPGALGARQTRRSAASRKGETERGRMSRRRFCASLSGTDKGLRIQFVRQAADDPNISALHGHSAQNDRLRMSDWYRRTRCRCGAKPLLVSLVFRFIQLIPAHGSALFARPEDRLFCRTSTRLREAFADGVDGRNKPGHDRN
jgi:hypothetical protein